LVHTKLLLSARHAREHRLYICMYLIWKNFFIRLDLVTNVRNGRVNMACGIQGNVSWNGQYTGKSHDFTIVLEVVVSEDL
jgi:hypothetical protein